MPDDPAHHPVADLFPMMADDELTELAADIAERGLLQPIILDGQGRILDGRNRHAACLQAGVEPAFETYDGDDPDGYALAVNVNRRHLKPGQRYIVTEQARRLAETNGAKKQKNAFSGSRGEQAGLSLAAVVLDFGAADLVPQIMSGGLALQEAAKTARARKQAMKEREQKIDRLKTAAPDLHSLVADDRMDPDEAVAALEAREEKARVEQAEREERERQELAAAEREAQEKAERERRDARVANTRFAQAMTTLYGLGTPEAIGWCVDRWDPENCESPPYDVTPENMRDAADTLESIAKLFEERGHERRLG